jgi:DNA-binding transcriptional LysR family regulator
VVITSHGGPEAETIRAAPGSPLASGTPTPGQLREQLWMLGPSAGSVDGEIAFMLRNLAIPEAQQRIFQSDAAACEEVQRVGGVTLTIGFAVATDLSAGRLTHIKGPGLQSSGEWAAATLPPASRQPAVSELVRFITTPRCTQAMIRGSGVGVTRFRPKVHVTLWS